MVAIVPIETPTLGDRSYLVHDGQVALVIDPQRDIDRVLGLAEAAGVRITHVFETHIHNDYVTGGLALAKVTGAAYHVSAADEVAYERVPIFDGDVIEVSDALLIRVIATPGHTYTHLSYTLESEGEHVGVFSGGSLLFGSTGRPAAAATGSPRDWTESPLVSFERAMFADLAQVRHHRPVAILDVRRAMEWRESHIDGAVNIPIHELLGRVAEVPEGKVWVHCASGYRASIAASILTSHGVQVVAVDDSFAEQAAASGLALVTGSGEPRAAVA